MRLSVAALTSAAALGAIGVVAITAAGAATTTGHPATLASVQANAAAAITLRVNDLNAAITKVNGSKDFGSGAPALAAYLQADIAPLQALGQKIAADTTLATAQADAATIYTNFRVLLLVLPAAHLAGNSDIVADTEVPALTADSAKAASKVNPSNQAVLQPLINDLNAQISAASSATTGLAASLMSDTPAQYNANNALLTPAKASVTSANGDVTKARADLQQIHQDLKAARATRTTAKGSTTTTTTAAGG
jgi:hypothetical protein